MIAAELQLGHPVEIEVSINGKITTLLSSIEKVINYTILLTPIYIGEKMVGFPPEYQISFIYMEDQLVYCWKNVSIKAVRHQNKIYHCVDLIAEAEIWNRRNAFRVYIGEKMNLISFGKNGPTLHKVLIKDISETGMAFISKEPFFVKHTVRLNLKIFSGQILQLSAQIVRTQPTEKADEVLYGCRLLEKNPLLTKHLMKIQQEHQRNKFGQ